MGASFCEHSVRRAVDVYKSFVYPSVNMYNYSGDAALSFVYPSVNMYNYSGGAALSFQSTVQ